MIRRPPRSPRTGSLLPDPTLFRSLRLFYPDPEKQKLLQESCSVASAAARELSGRIVYSGGTWIHPDYRKRLMPMILPRISRALALTRRSVEHTSELQSLMRNSYAVFCLQKKKILQVL